MIQAMRNHPNTRPSATAPAAMRGGMRKTNNATASAAANAYSAARHAGERRTARKKNNVVTGMAAATVERTVLFRGLKFCCQTWFMSEDRKSTRLNSSHLGTS